MKYILQHIIEVLEHATSPLSAKEIEDQLKSNNIFRSIDNENNITQQQIRRAIRDDNNTKIETIESSILTYRLKQFYSQLWVLKTVPEEEKASQTDDYQDSLKEYYNYDNFVANSQQIKAGDQAIIIDKKSILGFVNISSVDSASGSKKIRRCPKCPSTTIDRRKTKKPTYRCNKGHEFDEPIEELKSVTKYRANFDCFISSMQFKNDLIQLRPFYTKSYNQNMSMQRLDNNALGLFENIEQRLSDKSTTYFNLPSDQSYVTEEEVTYLGNDDDERETVIKAIKLRRGQQNFRKKLLELYDNTCVITGCKIVDILEAAHIRPYKGKNDHHPSNGLLLRADIHTLFDLHLVAIEPETLLIHFHPKVKEEYINFDTKNMRFISSHKPNKDSLKLRWEIFNNSFN